MQYIHCGLGLWRLFAYEAHRFTAHKVQKCGNCTKINLAITPRGFLVEIELTPTEFMELIIISWLKNFLYVYYYCVYIMYMLVYRGQVLSVYSRHVTCILMYIQ